MCVTPSFVLSLALDHNLVPVVDFRLGIYFRHSPSAPIWTIHNCNGENYIFCSWVEVYDMETYGTFAIIRTISSFGVSLANNEQESSLYAQCTTSCLSIYTFEQFFKNTSAATSAKYIFTSKCMHFSLFLRSIEGWFDFAINYLKNLAIWNAQIAHSDKWQLNTMD